MPEVVFRRLAVFREAAAPVHGSIDVAKLFEQSRRASPPSRWEEKKPNARARRRELKLPRLVLKQGGQENIW